MTTYGLTVLDCGFHLTHDLQESVSRVGWKSQLRDKKCNHKQVPKNDLALNFLGWSLKNRLFNLIYEIQKDEYVGYVRRTYERTYERLTFCVCLAVPSYHL